VRGELFLPPLLDLVGAQLGLESKKVTVSTARRRIVGASMAATSGDASFGFSGGV
jgi:hypothetical protein